LSRLPRTNVLDSILKLFKVNLCVPINIESSQNSKDFLLVSHIALTFEESFEIGFVQVPVAPIVDPFKQFFCVEIVCCLELAFELVSFQLVHGLFEDELRKRPLDPDRQSRSPTVFPLGGSRSEVVIFTRQ
jgi:hypothetical protein